MNHVSCITSMTFGKRTQLVAEKAGGHEVVVFLETVGGMRDGAFGKPVVCIGSLLLRDNEQSGLRQLP